MSGEQAGALTFLFTDIEGSTKRWERHPEAMARAVARHDEIMRAAIAAHRGHVFKTVGDAFCAVFPNAHDAVAATVAAQKAIADEDWGEIGPIRVRMGLHTGIAEERDADYFGPTVNRVARIMSAGHGGQMLLSSTTGDHVGEQMPPDVRVRDLGKHRLKDLARPERLLQLMASGLPASFPRLKTVPSPTPGFIAAGLTMLAPLIAFRVGNRSSSEEVSASLFSPLSLYTGLKGLVIELSTLNEYVLLAVGLLFLLLAAGIVVARWRDVRRARRARGDIEETRFNRWVINQRTVAFLAAIALLVLGAYGYQQYLWRVALPIPDDALGIAMTREASAATVQEQLADSLYSQGKAEQVVIRELPVVFDARDTDRARELGKRIDARAVIIYRTDESSADGTREYIAYVVFTDPSVGLTIAGTPDDKSQTSGPLVVKEGVPVPVLRTDTLDELVNAAAGIIAYDDNDPRKAIEYLTLALPPDPAGANTGIVNFYLGNAYNLDNQPDLAAGAYEEAATFYEQRIDNGELLGPQDQLILAKTYLERGRAASFRNDWDAAIEWYEKALTLRADLLARSDELERPTDVHASYARLYSLMADAYRFLEMPEDQRSWEQRAQEEIDALEGMTAPGDAYGFVQQSTARTFIGDCVAAQQALEQALEADPTDTDVLINAGVISLLQDRPDLARDYWQRIAEAHPNDVAGRQLIAMSWVLDALQESYFEPAYMEEAERQYEEIIAIDPTNVDAHEELASVSSIRASGLILDSTALVDMDDLSVSKSQYDWPLAPDRQQAVLDVYAAVIDEYRLIASELQPGSAEAEIAVAEAYLARAQFLYSALVGPLFNGEAVPDSDARGEQLLADVEQVREWAGRVLDNPNATRLDSARAWATLVEADDREWGWYLFVERDDAKAAEVEQTYRQRVEDALTFVEAESISSTDEIGPIRIVYYKALFITQTLDEDEEAAAPHREKITELSQRETQEREQGISHYATSCNEKRNQQQGEALLRSGDIDGAKEHFASALEANPEHIPSLRGYAEALYRAGDVDGAIEQATRATDAAPDMPGPWLDLTIYHLIDGDSAAETSIDRFLSLAGQLPAQARMSVVGDAIDRIESVITNSPDLAGEATTLIPHVQQFLNDMEPEPLPSYQYPGLYARLGEVALFADDAAMAEPILRRAIELDPHLPITHADLVVSLLVQGKDATNEMKATFDDIANPYWTHIAGYDDAGQWLTNVEREVGRYTDSYPDRAAALEPFLSAIASERSGGGDVESTTGLDGNVYTSGYGYTLSWDERWTVVSSSADATGGDDSIQITDGESILQMNGGPGDDPAGCLNNILTAISGDPAWEAVVPARDADGHDVAESGPNLAYAAFTDPLEGDAAAVYYIGCHALSDPGVLARVLVVVPAASYETERDAVNAVLGTFTPGEAADAGSSQGTVMELPEIALQPGERASAEAGITYISPTHGYSLEIGPPWRVETSESDNGVDAVLVTNGDDRVYIESMGAGSTNPGSCVLEVSRGLSYLATVSNIVAATDASGTAVQTIDSSSAFATFTFGEQQQDGSVRDSTVYVRCQILDSDTLLRIVHAGPSDTWDGSAVARDALLKTLVLAEPGGDRMATPVPGIHASPAATPMD